MTTLYYAPGACSLGIHVLLEEIGKPYTAEPVNLQKGEQYAPPFTDINPKSKVPTLRRDDGSVLTEYPAIAMWLALTNPDKKLVPTDPEGIARTLEAMDHAVASIHMQAFSRLFRPTNFAPNESDQETVKAKGKELAAKGFALMEQRLAGKDYLEGAFSIADTALFYVEFWAKRLGVDLPPNCEAHFTRMMARPAVQRALKAEGLA